MGFGDEAESCMDTESIMVISEPDELRAVMRICMSDTRYCGARLYDSVCHVLSSSLADACQSNMVFHVVPSYSSIWRYSP